MRTGRRRRRNTERRFGPAARYRRRTHRHHRDAPPEPGCLRARPSLRHDGCPLGRGTPQPKAVGVVPRTNHSAPERRRDDGPTTWCGTRRDTADVNLEWSGNQSSRTIMVKNRYRTLNPMKQRSRPHARVALDLLSDSHHRDALRRRWIRQNAQACQANRAG